MLSTRHVMDLHLIEHFAANPEPSGVLPSYSYQTTSVKSDACARKSCILGDLGPLPSSIMNLKMVVVHE